MKKSIDKYSKVVILLGKIAVFVLSIALLFAFYCCENTTQMISITFVAIFITIPAFLSLFLEDWFSEKYPKTIKYFDIARLVCIVATSSFVFMILLRFIIILFVKF